MKKLSIEEKAKAYDKKLAEAKEMLIDGGISQNTIDYIQKLYPELKCSADSEDERIINNIRKVIRWYRGIFTEKSLMPEQYQEINAWLEKQVEQKLYVNDNAKEMFIKALERVEEQNNKGYKLTDCDKNSWWEDFKAYTSCTVEQKPAWREEDELNIRELESLVKQVWATAEHGNDKDTIHKMSDLSFFLKTLKPQLKQEWSKEDEILLKLSLENLTELKDRFGEYYGRVGGCIDWLKSLKDRYAWRPSDEQMRTLEHYMHTLVCNEHKEILLGLYSDLKELRGE